MSQPTAKTVAGVPDHPACQSCSTCPALAGGDCPRSLCDPLSHGAAQGSATELARDNAVYVCLALGSLGAAGWVVTNGLRPLAWLVGVWLLANVYVWMSPTWRLSIILHRGANLGLGFAFAAALLSTVLAWQTGAVHPVSAFFYYAGLFAWPFVWAKLRPAEPGEPTLIDAVVLLYGLAAVRLGWFDPVPADPTGMIGPGPHPSVFSLLAVGALLATYFFGVRQWQEVSTYWHPRRSDWQIGGVAAIAALAGLAALTLAGMTPPWQALRSGIGSTLIAIGVVAVISEMIFRGLVQPAVARLLPTRGKWVAVPIGAVVFALITASSSNSVWAGLPAGLALGWATSRSDRLFPAIVARVLVVFVSGQLIVF